MTTLDNIPSWWGEAEEGVNKATKDFVIRMETKLTKLRPISLLKNKSPFLSCIRAPNSVEELAANMVNDWLSSSAETVLGNVIEEAAVAVCAAAKGGRKATAEGMDLEFVQTEQGRSVLYLGQVKSGSNWGNSSQRKELAKNFLTVEKRVKQNTGSQQIVCCFEGISYGPSKVNLNAEGYKRYIGKSFWKHISGWEGTMEKVLEVVQEHAGNGLRAARQKSVDEIKEFMEKENLSIDGKVDWKKLL